MRRGWAVLAGGTLTVAAAVFGLGLPGSIRGGPPGHLEPGLSGPAAQPSETCDAPGRSAPRTAGRDLAFGQLIDVPRPIEVIDEGIRIADALRRRYGIETGDLEKDRREAARRARVELLEPMSVPEERLEAIARSLGHSLDPAACADYCGNVRRLAEIEARKVALREWASEDDDRHPAGSRVPLTKPAAREQIAY